MTSYRIEHRTTYTYDSDVTGSYGLFHLRPRDLAWQSCLAHEIAIEPEPADLSRHIDLYGNAMAYFHVVQPHTRLVVTSISLVEVGVIELDPLALAVPWEWAQPRLRDDDGEAWEAMDFTFPSPYVEVPSAIEDYAHQSFPAGRPIGEAAVELMHRIHGDFRYQSGSTTLRTKVSDLLEKRTGVCQDFAHFMVAGLRSLGLAARYVSGYLAGRHLASRGRPRTPPAMPGWAAGSQGLAGCISTRPTTASLTTRIRPSRGGATTATYHPSRA
jgi:transglutaminase-like putative cysteine protease